MVTNINKGTNGFGKVIAPHVRITGYMNIMNLHRSYICFLRRPWFLGSSGSLGSCARESQEATDRDNRNQGNTTDRLHGDRGPYHFKRAGAGPADGSVATPNSIDWPTAADHVHGVIKHFVKCDELAAAEMVQECRKSQRSDKVKPGLKAN